MPDTTDALDPADLPVADAPGADPTETLPTDGAGPTSVDGSGHEGPPGGPPDDEHVVYLPPERGILRRAAPMVAAAVAVLLVVAALGGWWVSRQVDPPGAPGPAVTVAIPNGSSDSQIASVLAAHGVVTNATVFRYYVKIRGAGPFKAGVYDGLHAPEDMSDVVDRLEKGPLPPATISIVIPEGLWLSEIRAKILKTFPLMQPAALDHALATVRSKYEPAGSNNLEGLLFPATYQVLLGDRANPTKLVQQMVDAFDQQADSIGLSQASQKLGLSPYQVLTVASMVEEEAKVPGDRAKVARVIDNRLSQGMTLGLDATVEYALQRRITNLTDTDLAVDSPYNTRTHTGLPPTPISSPGRASLLAALNPASGDWIYFVLADKDGGLYFTSSYRDFQNATARAKAEGLFGG